MKILILHKWLVTGGVETVLINYRKILEKSGHNVDILITYKTNSKINSHNIRFAFTSKEFNFIYSKENNLYQKILRGFYKSYQKLRYYNLINSICHKYDYIIDFSSCLDSYIRNPFFRKNDIKTIRWVHNQLSTNLILSKKEKNKYYNIFRNHNKVVVLCKGMRKLILEQVNIDKNKLFILSNPIDIPTIKKKGNINKTEINQVMNSTPYLLQVSRLTHRKGHEQLIDIYYELKKKGISHKLYFIGDGNNRKNLENKVLSLRLENDILFLGEMENPYPYFKNAKLFLHCSESEGLPTVILESMVFGVPVIAMNCHTGPKDILGEKGEFGKLIPMYDKTKFIAETLELLTNDDIYKKYSNKSLERIEQFSMEKIALGLDNLFYEK
ncbi:glycosyltransferase [Rodentibacter pneumotropicus]|uniref:glycosyltransferase n=2 Tax=Rodentibacter pneumotropicus TaxID=758 RepID=UPI00037AD996|nr:glycosyltransferase [Rodentibacter pneumotropicus]